MPQEGEEPLTGPLGRAREGTAPDGAADGPVSSPEKDEGVERTGREEPSPLLESVAFLQRLADDVRLGAAGLVGLVAEGVLSDAVDVEGLAHHVAAGADSRPPSVGTR